MAPFHFQIEAASHHSVWGVETLKTGAFTPPALVGPVPFADLQAMIGKAEKALEASSPKRLTAARASTWTSRSARDGLLSRRRPSFSLSRCHTSISTPSPHTTSCAREACRSVSVITRVGCAPDHPEMKSGLQRRGRCHSTIAIVRYFLDSQPSDFTARFEFGPRRSSHPPAL